MLGFLGYFHASYFKQQPFRIVANQDFHHLFSWSFLKITSWPSSIRLRYPGGAWQNASVQPFGGDGSRLRKRRCFKMFQEDPSTTSKR